MQAAAVAIHGDNRWEFFDAQVPDGFGRAKVHPVDAFDGGDALGANLGGATDGVQIDTAVILAALEGFGAHAALADHRADAVVAHDFPLIGLFTDRGGGAGGAAGVFAIFFDHHRPAVVNNLASEIHRRLGTGVDAVVNGITTGVHQAGDFYGITNL